MKKPFKTIRSRWRKKMPRFFKRMMWIGGLMSGTAIAVHEVFDHYGIVADDWWIFIERYLIGGGAGIAFACKFTVKGGFKNDNANDNDNQNQSNNAAPASEGSPDGDGSSRDSAAVTQESSPTCDDRDTQARHTASIWKGIMGL